MKVGRLTLVLVLAALSCQDRFEPHSVPDGGDAGSDGGPCEGVTCSGHGRCIEAEAGGAWCDCYSGFEPEGLECVPEGSDGDADADAEMDRDGDQDADPGADGDIDGDGGRDADAGTDAEADVNQDGGSDGDDADPCVPTGDEVCGNCVDEDCSGTA